MYSKLKKQTNKQTKKESFKNKHKNENTKCDEKIQIWNEMNKQKKNPKWKSEIRKLLMHKQNEKNW